MIKILFLVFFFTDGSMMKIRHKPLVSCEKDVELLNNSLSIMVYNGEKIEGKTIHHAEWRCEKRNQ